MPLISTDRNRGYRALPCLSLMTLVTALSACTVPGTVANVTWKVVDNATQERGLDGAIDDLAIQTALNAVFASTDSALFIQTSTIVHEGRALLTGVVENEQDRHLATQLAWEVNGVRDVINDLKIGDNETVDLVSDELTAFQFENAIMASMDISSRNYRARVVGNTLYLMGVAHDDEERHLVNAYARAVPGIREVRDHTRLKADSLPIRPRDATALAALINESMADPSDFPSSHIYAAETDATVAQFATHRPDVTAPSAARPYIPVASYGGAGADTPRTDISPTPNVPATAGGLSSEETAALTPSEATSGGRRVDPALRSESPVVEVTASAGSPPSRLVWPGIDN